MKDSFIVKNKHRISVRCVPESSYSLANDLVSRHAFGVCLAGAVMDMRHSGTGTVAVFVCTEAKYN